MDVCECGLDFDAIERSEIDARVDAAVAGITTLLLAEPESATRRPAPERWSGIEYAAHVRDVMLTIRDRLVIGLVEDRPGFKPLYREQRVDLGLYRSDTAEAVSDELRSAAAMFQRLFGAIDEAQRRTGV